MNKRLIIGMILCLSVFAAESVEPVAGAFTVSVQKDSLTPYTQASEVPQTAVDLWKDYDPRQGRSRGEDSPGMEAGWRGLAAH